MKNIILSAFADEASPSMAGQIAALQRNSVSGLELRSIDGENVSDLSLSKAKEIFNAFQHERLSIWSAGSPIGKIGITEPFGPHLDKLRHTIDVARELHAENLRLFSFYMPKGDDPANWTNAVIDRLGAFLEAAEDSGVCLCHENEKGIYGDIAPRCAEIHKALPKLRAVFDPANYVQCGQETLSAWELIKPYIRYMHIKDAMPDGSVVPAGKGAGHVAEICADYLSRGGYAFTLEPHLTVFEGLGKLEQEGERSKVGAYAYPTADAAFDAACGTFRELLESIIQD